MACPPHAGEIDLDRVDLADPSLYAHGDPHPVWREMRLREPVRWQETDRGPGFWSVTTHELGIRVLRDSATFTSERGTLLNLLGKSDPAAGRQLVATDPPRHRQMREPLRRALAMRSIDRLRDDLTAHVRRLLLPARSQEPFDFADAIGGLPVAAAGSLLGLPEADYPEISRLSLMAVAPDDPEYTVDGDPGSTLVRAHRELFAYFSDTIRDRRRKPQRDDLIGLLLGMEVDGRAAAPGEVVANCYSLLLGALVTTPYVPTAMLAELAGTDVLTRMLAGPGIDDPAIEEALRWSSPANHFMRHAQSDLEMAGRRIRAGDAIVVWIGSANRDEEVFEAPYTFDPSRKGNRHIAFGSGAHYCVGHSVARLSLRVLFDELDQSFSNFEPAGESEHLRSNFIAGIKHLPLVARRR
ncbi:cytochrome P450 [Nocardiopsis ansamitocini]|nr:cytochrome P450 [Nocardiopsis ansamitocini]